MKKLKRILALLGAILLAGLYAATLVLSLMSSPNAKNMLMAAIAVTVILPCLLYAMILIARVLDRRSDADREKEERKNLHD